MQLLIVSDDLTGALDTGVQFAGKGAKVKVYNFLDIENQPMDLRDIDVLILNTNSRHVSPEEAYQMHRNVAYFAQWNHIQQIYKKTDSLLRGNIGADLSGLLDGTQSGSAFFIPAAPYLKRTTKKGVQYADGIPISESMYANNPMEPIKDSDVLQILAAQTSLPIRLVAEDTDLGTLQPLPGLTVFDAESDARLLQISHWVQSRPECRIIAGCAGFGQMLAKRIRVKRGNGAYALEPGNMLSVIGTTNPLTRAQIRQATQFDGFEERNLYIDVLRSEPTRNAAIRDICKGIRAGKKLIITFSGQSEEDIAGIDAEHMEQFANEIGAFVAEVFQAQALRCAFIAGGDTAFAVMRSIGCTEIMPICELDNGTVYANALTKYGTINIITKSGALGSIDVFDTVYRSINHSGKQEVPS